MRMNGEMSTICYFTVTVIKSNIQKWAGHVVRMRVGGGWGTFKIVTGGVKMLTESR
jgi:hypothetical protein